MITCFLSATLLHNIIIWIIIRWCKCGDLKGTEELRGTHTHSLVEIIWNDLVWNAVPMLSGVFGRSWVAAGVTKPPCHTGVSAAAPPAVTCPPQPCLDVHEEGSSAWNEALVLFLVYLFIYLAWLLHYPPAALLFFHLHASSADMRSIAFLHHPIFIVCLAKDEVVLQEELVSNTKPGQMKQLNRALHHRSNRNLLLSSRSPGAGKSPVFTIWVKPFFFFSYHSRNTSTNQSSCQGRSHRLTKTPESTGECRCHPRCLTTSGAPQGLVVEPLVFTFINDTDISFCQ